VLAGCCEDLVRGPQKYVALEPIGLVCGCTRDRDPSYLGLTNVKMERKSELYSAHAVAVVAGQHPKGWVYPTGKGPCKLQVKTCLFDLMPLLFFLHFYNFFLLFNQQSKDTRQLRLVIHVIQSPV